MKTRGRKGIRNRGRKRPPDAEHLLAQVQEQFGKVKERLGAEEAAKQLRVGKASFYNYVNGDTLPDMEVLRRANDIWGFKCKYIDFAEILPKQKAKSPRQLVFAFLQLMRSRDVQVVQVGPRSENVLEVTLNIRFSA